MNKTFATMKTAATALLLILAVNTNAQQGELRDPPRKHARGESFGNTLNLGLGIGYYGYIGYTVPMFFANYELNVARNFTLAPFIGISSYRSNRRYNWGGNYYYYRETVIPVGVKGTYYFDELLGANSHWDFYLAGSLGFVYNRVVWDDGYMGNKDVYRGASPLYLDAHIGAEYHFNTRVGMFLDLSTGVSTLGLAIHHK